jgi:AraC-like DNA-binding protein
MRTCFTPTIKNCIERPASDVTKVYDELFRFHADWAIKTYFPYQKAAVLCRQRYSNKNICLELYQSSVWNDLRIFCKFTTKCPVLIIVLTGHVNVLNKGGDVLEQLHSRDCFITHWEPDQYHFLFKKGKSKLLLIAIEETWFKSIIPAYRQLSLAYANVFSGKNIHSSLPLCYLKFTLGRLAIQLFTYQETDRNQLNIYLEHQLKSILKLYDSSLVDQKGSPEQRVHRVTGYILTFIRDQKKIPDIRRIAKEVGLSQRDLENTCISITGMTPVKYMNSLRLNEGRRLLLETDYTINRIADNLSYSSHSHFSSAFRLHFGVTPVSLREKPH